MLALVRHGLVKKRFLRKLFQSRELHRSASCALVVWAEVPGTQWVSQMNIR